MKKKILYGIFFVSIFLLSTASMVQPVRGYSWGVPKEAIGVTSESEISIYDEDEFEDCLGSGIDISDFKDGDVDVVGAKSKSTYKEMETDEDLIKYEEDHVYAAVDFEESADEIRLTLTEIGNATTLLPDEDLPPIIEILKGITYLVLGGADPRFTSAMSADNKADAGIPSWETLMNMYSDKYDGSYLTRDLWDPTEDAYKAKPDTKDDEVPFLADPRDWYASYKNMKGLEAYIVGTCNSIQSDLDAWILGLLGAPADIAAVNATFANPAVGLPADLLYALGNITLPGYPNYPVASYILASYVVQNIKYSTMAAVPDKLGYLLLLLEAGQPVYVPQDDFLARMLKEFDAEDDFDGDRKWKIPYIAYGEDTMGLLGTPVPDDSVSAVPYGLVLQPFPTIAPTIFVPLGGETIYIYAYVDLDVEGGTLTFSIEYDEDGQEDPKDTLDPDEDDPNELSDWEWVFAYGDTGTSSESIKNGDTIIWQVSGIDQIPGFEITIIVGASAVAILGLIYVVMKKRKM